jgi:RNA recognition motif-containing protein
VKYLVPKSLQETKFTALIEFESPEQAQTAMSNLSGAPYFGRTLSINLSKHKTINLGHKLDDPNIYVPSIISKEHRFRVEHSKNHENITVSFLIFNFH